MGVNCLIRVGVVEFGAGVEAGSAFVIAFAFSLFLIATVVTGF